MNSTSAKILLFLVLLISVNSNILGQELDEMIRQRVEFVRFQESFVRGDPIVCRQSLFTFYENRQFFPAWEKDKDIQELIEILEIVDDHGLKKEDYHYIKIKNLWEKNRGTLISKHTQANFDIMLSDAYLLLAGHLLSGKVDPKKFDPNWFAVKNEGHPIEILEKALQTGVKNSLDLLLPNEPAYLKMVAYLKKLNEVANSGDWEEIITREKKIEKGYSAPEITLIKKRLAVLGDYSLPDTSNTYQDEMEAAVISFQKRHGLLADGVIGQQTIDAMNFHVKRRMDQLKINMERFRWLNRDLGDNYILINIANYELDVFENDKKVLVKKVVVGKNYRMTPVFSSTMNYVVLNPDWTVPPTILKNDILSVAKKDPSIIQKKKLKVVGLDGKSIDPSTIDWSQYPSKPFPYLLKQDSGPDNALGSVKFNFPNNFNVYLHDTPQKDFFDKTDRALSSGCIRVEKPLELAEWVLNDKPGWDRQKIDATISTKQTTTVFLNKKVNVHLQYFTSWVDDNGVLQFRKDIYERDSLVFRALNEHMETVSLPEINR